MLQQSPIIRRMMMILRGVWVRLCRVCVCVQLETKRILSFRSHIGESHPVSQSSRQLALSPIQSNQCGWYMLSSLKWQSRHRRRRGCRPCCTSHTQKKHRHRQWQNRANVPRPADSPKCFLLSPLPRPSIHPSLVRSCCLWWLIDIGCFSIYDYPNQPYDSILKSVTPCSLSPSLTSFFPHGFVSSLQSQIFFFYILLLCRSFSIVQYLDRQMSRVCNSSSLFLFVKIIQFEICYSSPLHFDCNLR